MEIRRRGISVKIDGMAAVRVESDARFQDGTLHLELVRLLALGCKNFDIDLGNVRAFDDAAVSDIVSWYHTLTYRHCRPRLLNVSSDIARKLESTAAFAAIHYEPEPFSPSGLRLLALQAAVKPPADTVPKYSPHEDWGPVAAGYVSLGQWARMQRKRSH